MNDATYITSPANIDETVGNSSKCVRVLEREQKRGKDSNFSLTSIWVAFVHQVSQDVANPTKPLTNSQISFYGSYYGTLIPNTESGEGVVSSGDVVQVLDYYPYGTKRISSGTDTSQREFIGEIFDESSQLSYLNARYLNSQNGQFLSQDPMFWGKQNLQNPQSMNSYSYAEGNPINKKDPTGLASYIWANGAGMTGIDTWNKGTYYQTGDNAMLQTNAAMMQAAQPGSSIGGLALFTQNVWPGSVWDFKAGANAQGGNRGFYFFGDKLVPAEVYGNLHYGYVGAAGGLSSFELRGGAGLAHVMTALFGPARIGPMSSYFDDPRDQASIQQGINTYNSTLISSMSGFSSSNIQTRVSSINSFNSASGASSNEKWG